MRWNSGDFRSFSSDCKLDTDVDKLKAKQNAKWEFLINICVLEMATRFFVGEGCIQK